MVCVVSSLDSLPNMELPLILPYPSVHLVAPNLSIRSEGASQTKVQVFIVHQHPNTPKTRVIFGVRLVRGWIQ